MSGRSFVFVLLITLGSLRASTQSPVLVRGSAVVIAQTSHGEVPVKLTPVVPSLEVTAVILSETLQPVDILRVRRALLVAFGGSFFAVHSLRLVDISGGGNTSTHIANIVQLQAASKRLSARQSPSSSATLIAVLGSLPSVLPSNWAHVVIIGRLGSSGTGESDEPWMSAWLAEAYQKQHIRASFWSVDGTVPTWAQNLSGATAGLVATSDLGALLPVLNETASVFFEATWENTLERGAWPCLIGLRNSAGERLGLIQTMMKAPSFALPLEPYLAARRNLRSAATNDGSAALKVLEFNPSDVDALRRLARIYANHNKVKESAALWRQLTDITPQDGPAWAELAAESYAAQSYDEAEQALIRAGTLGVKNRVTLETQGRFYIRRKNFAGALPLLEEALTDDKELQGLWLLRADCAHNLKRWPLEAESLERALALGPVPLERRTDLINGYLAAGQPDRALPHLRTVSITQLPPNAAIRAQYAGFWEQLHDSSAAETLWQSALAADAKFELAYLGLTQHFLAARRAADAIEIANSVEAIPGSLPLVLAKEAALEAAGDRYAARRLLNERAPGANQVDLLKRWASLEDYYGAAGVPAYMALVNALVRAGAPKAEVVAACRRGLLVALRTEHLGAARAFANKLANAGDRSAVDLLEIRKSAAQSRTEILGGADALHFLVIGGAKSKPEQILTDCSHALSAIAPDSNRAETKVEWQKMAGSVHEYFQRLSALATLGRRKQDHFEILLSLNTKADKQRTEKVFGILGLKLKTGKAGLTLQSAEGKSQIKKQDTLAALAIDDQAIAQALAVRKPYALEVALDSVPVFPAAELWQKAFYQQEHFPGGLVEAFVTDVRLPQLYLALNSMDRTAAEALVGAIPLRTLAERFSVPLSLFSAALAMQGGHAEVPGGDDATTAWQQLVGVNPADAVAFFQALLTKDDGRLIAYFYTLSQLDSAHQRFFTRSPERAKRFYDVFHESSEMRHGGEHRLGSSSFVEFLRDVPLNEDGSVDFPGGPEVWMVAKGRNASATSVAKLTRKLKRTTAPDNEDEILIRLAHTANNSQNHQQSELANFIAVTRLDAQRDEPLDAASALLVAQGYAPYSGLYPYFAALGDLEAADYRQAFSFEARLSVLDTVTANISLGQLHSFLALLGLLRQSGLAQPKDLLHLYRRGMEGFSKAGDAAAWTVASLSAMDDLARVAAPDIPSRDAAIRVLLLGRSSSGMSSREKAYRQLLALQKVPSLDSLFAIWTALQRASKGDPAALDEAQRQLSTFEVLTPPKAWKVVGDCKRNLERYQTAEAQAILLKLREKLSKRKRNPGDIEKLYSEFMAELQPWTELAMAGQIYARFLDPTDLVASEDPMLLRKHEFVSLLPKNGKIQWFPPAQLDISSEGEGSYFTGGFAEFSLAAGRARVEGNHLAGAGSAAFAGALFASIRATDWRGLTASELQSFGATVRLAREWIVESAATPALQRELAQDTRGLLSLNRRKALLEAVDRRDWPAVWEAVSVSDLHFLGDALLQNAPKDLWNSPALNAMKQAASHTRELDLLGSVAPELNGCAQPRLRRYEPYEEYQRHALPDRLAQRLAELKLYLAWLADGAAWQPETLAALAPSAADAVISKTAMRDMWDWNSALDAYRSLTAETLQPLLSRP